MAWEDEAVSGGGGLGRPILLWFGPIVSPTLTPGIFFFGVLFLRVHFFFSFFSCLFFFDLFLTFLFYEYVLFFCSVLLISRQWLLKGGVFACGGELSGDWL